ncbi:MAG: tetratricopeptide repeat protein [Candidatus Krumholzibacteriia bacterium]
MRRFGLVTALLLIAYAAGGGPRRARAEEPVAAESARALFARANALYESGDYAGAIEAYTGVMDGGVVDETLYYNLGNAYYKTNDLGRAVLFYERSARLSPRDPDVRENLTLVRTQLKDKQFVENKSRLAQRMIWFHDNLRTAEMLSFASLAYLLLCTLAVVFIFRETRFVTIVHHRLSVISPGRLFGLTLTQELLAAIALLVILVATTGFSSYLKLQEEMRRPDAVVLAREIPVFGSPTEDATLRFKIHEGTMVTVGEARRGWVRIQLPGGLSGWVSANSVERV